MQMIPCWQAAFLTHYMNREVIAGNQVTFDGIINVSDNEIQVLGTIIIGGRRIDLKQSAIQMDMPYSLAIGLRGKKLKELISIPDTGEKEIDDGYDSSTINEIKTENGKIWIGIEGPAMNYALNY